MSYITYKKCSTCNKVRPCFIYPTEPKILSCVSCKLENMVDITSKKCIVCNSTRPYFNYPNEEKSSYSVFHVN